MKTTEKTGTVYLVGAGPGDPELITVKGVIRLNTCDTVVYDSLSSDRLLELAPRAEKIYVGKRAGRHSMKQEEINELLVELGCAGKTVVRLKGGDPFVFGRGGEEVQALQEAGIPYEVIPGVTSAVAVPASAGIPVTHRAVSRSFHVMTGHTLSDDGTLPPDFPEFARLSGTLVFLMGLGNLHPIVSGLLKAGKSKDTPAAVIENGTLPQERSVKGTLGTIEELAEREGIGTPAIIVVGDTAALDMRATMKQPLAGVSVCVTGTSGFTKKLLASLHGLGADGECVCRLGVKSYLDSEAMKEAYGKLKEYSWLVFTSANAVRLFFEGLEKYGLDCRSLGNVKIAAVGKGTARELRQYGFLTDYVPERYQVEDLAAGLEHMVKPGEKLLIPRSFGGSRILNETLDRAGILYDDVVLYDVEGQWREKERLEERLRASQYLTFASGSGVEAFFDGLTESERLAVEQIRVVCIGDVTARALEARGRKADVIAETFSIPGMTAAILKDTSGRECGQIISFPAKGKINEETEGKEDGNDS